MYYTGIGSRETPKPIMDHMSRMARVLATRGHTLRSGGADGADRAFETGHSAVNQNIEVYIPWRKFVCDLNPWHRLITDKATVERAAEVAKSIHPAWDRCSPGAKLLHTRNVYQVLGADLKNPSAFVMCWTRDGQATGGTRTAIVLAQRFQVPVFNLYSLEDQEPLNILKNVTKNISEPL